MLISQIDHHPYFGRMLRGKINSGSLKVGDELDTIGPDGQLVESFKISKIFKPHFVDNVDKPKLG